MTDFYFLLVIAVFAILTPKESAYKNINLILAAKFSIFVGIMMIITGLNVYGAGITDGWWVDAYRFILDSVFVYLFYRAGGMYLASLCVTMAFFHLTNIFVGYDYQPLMIGFQVLQLMAATWGVIDGFDCRLCARSTRRGVDQNGHA